MDVGECVWGTVQRFGVPGLQQSVRFKRSWVWTHVLPSKADRRPQPLILHA